MSDTRTCGQAIAALLEDYGVDTVFGIPGVHTLELYRGLAASGIRHVLVRHEQGAGFMADGFARASGRPGVCILITGPGVTNAATPMGQAYSDSVPMLVISSVNATGDLGRGHGMLHEITDQRAASAPLTAFSGTAHTAADIPELVGHAFGIFAGRRPRPVHIEVPLDVLMAPAAGDWSVRAAGAPPAPDAEGVAAAVRLLAGAERPAIVAGGGARSAGPSVRRIAEALGATVMTTVAGKGIVPDSHPLSFGSCMTTSAGREALADADAVLAIGTELSATDHYVDRLPLPDALIRVDIDAGRTGDPRYPAAVAIHADAAATAAALAAALEDMALDRQHDAAEARVATLRRNLAGRNHPLHLRHKKVLDVLRAALPEDGVVASDMTQIAYTGLNTFPTERPDTWFHPSGYGTLGYALPAAIGAKLALPDRAVVALAGDAGFLFTVQELATAAELGLPVAVLLWNNDALGQIRDDMVADGIPEIGVVPRNPDFQTIGRAFGCHTARPDGLDELGAALGEAFGADGPTLIEMRHDVPELI